MVNWLKTPEDAAFAMTRNMAKSRDELKHQNRQLVEQLAQAREGQQWQLIETAPKDGTPFIAACRMDAFRAFYDLEQEVWICEDDGLWFGALPILPTHWMPLPDPPVAASAVPVSTEEK